jgi:hypothetical protein
MNNARNDRSKGRQSVIDSWFVQFVEAELYDQKDYHAFCKRMKDLSHFEIERIFRKEKMS